MRKNFLLGLISIVATAVISATIVSCVKDSRAASGESYQYRGPGSDWTIKFNTNGTFTMTEAVAGTSINGTYSVAQSGFTKMVVTSASGSGAPAAGAEAYGMNIPGFAFILKPAGVEAIIPAMSAGSCPNTSMTANWVKTNVGNSSNASTTDVFGTFSYNSIAKSATLPTKYRLNDFSLVDSNQSLGAFNCSNGIATVSDAMMYFTTIGGAAVNTGYSNPTEADFIIGMPQTNIGAMNNLNGTYIGFGFDDSNSSGNKQFNFQFSIASGGGTGYQVSPDTGLQTNSNTATLAFAGVDSPSLGFARGTMSASSVSRNIICQVVVNANASNKNIIMCAGLGFGDATKLYSLIMVNK